MHDLKLQHEMRQPEDIRTLYTMSLYFYINLVIVQDKQITPYTHLGYYVNEICQWGDKKTARRAKTFLYYK